MYLDLWKNKPSFIIKDGVKEEYMSVEKVDSQVKNNKEGMNIIANMVATIPLNFTKEFKNGGNLKGNSYRIGLYFDNGYKLFVNCTKKQYSEIRDICSGVEHYNQFGNVVV